MMSSCQPLNLLAKIIVPLIEHLEDHLIVAFSFMRVPNISVFPLLLYNDHKSCLCVHALLK